MNALTSDIANLRKELDDYKRDVQRVFDEVGQANVAKNCALAERLTKLEDVVADYLRD